MINNIEIVNPIIKGDITMEAIKKDLNSRMGQELLILSRRIWQNEVKYVRPKRMKITGATDSFIMTESNLGIKETYGFSSFFCGDIMYEVVQHNGKR